MVRKNYLKQIENHLSPKVIEESVCNQSTYLQKKKKPQTEIELKRWGQPFTPLNYQREIIEGINKLVLGGAPVQGFLALPTGSGKTLTTCRLVLDVLLSLRTENPSVLWIAPQKELLFQALSAFQAAWWAGAGPPSLDICVVNTKNKFNVPVRPTIWLMTPKMAESLLAEVTTYCNIAIFDEAHHVAAEVFGKIWQYICEQERIMLALGLSATPSRESNDELHILQKSFAKILFVPKSLGINPVKTLIESQVLAQPIFHRLENIPSYARYQTNDKRTMQSLIADQDRWDCITSSLVEDIQGQTVVYALDKEHGKLLARHLRYLGENAEFVDGDTDISTRDSIFERFRNGQTRIIVNIKLFIEGVDCPAAENVVFTYPTQAHVRLHQMVGRVLRGPKIGGTPIGNVYGIEGSQQWLDGILFKGDYRYSGWKVCEL